MADLGISPPTPAWCGALKQHRDSPHPFSGGETLAGAPRCLLGSLPCTASVWVGKSGHQGRSEAMSDVLPAASCLLAEYDVLRVIGRGTYGKALLVTRKTDHCILVIKQVDLNELEEHEKAAALNEVTVLSKFDHINIIRYHTCFTQNDLLHIVMEHADQGDLATMIQRQADVNKPFAEADIMNWCASFDKHARSPIATSSMQGHNLRMTAAGLCKFSWPCGTCTAGIYCTAT